LIPVARSFSFTSGGIRTIYSRFHFHPTQPLEISHAMISKSRFLAPVCAAMVATALPATAQEIPDVSDITANAAQAVDMNSLDNLLSKLTSQVDISSIQGAEVVDFQKGIFRYRGGVTIDYQGTRILAETAEFNRTTGEITVRDGVAIYRDGMLYRGDTAVFDINTNTITSDNLRSSVLASDKEVYFETGDLVGGMNSDDGSPGVIQTRNTQLTTHDSSHPNWYMRARTLDIYPDDKMVFRNMTVYAGGIPVFWLPYLSQKFDTELGYSFTPGYDSAMGFFLLNKYGSLLGDGNYLTIAKLDLFEKRGLGGGFDIIPTRERGNPNYGILQAYYVNDSDPTISRSGRTRNFPPDADRYRLGLQHRFYFRGYEERAIIDEFGDTRTRTQPFDDTLFVDVDLTYLSDEFMLEDFYPDEFRVNPQPANNVNLVKTNDLWSASLLGSFRINTFFQNDSRLPEIAFETVRTPIFGSKVQYQGLATYGIVEEKPSDELSRLSNRQIASLRENLDGFANDPDFTALNPDFDPVETQSLLDDLRAGVADRGFNRFDTYHEVSMPFTAMGWLSLVPRGGIRYTNYSSVDGAVSSAQDRGLAHIGMDASMKISRDYDIVNRSLGLDGLRHVIQPYARYSLVQGDELPAGFPRIDRITPSTRPRPIDLGRWTAIDTINDWNLVRLGTAHRLLTRHDNATHSWFDFDTYFDTFLEDPEFDRDFSNLYMDFAWRPLPWLSFTVGSQFDIFGEESGFTEINPGIRWMPNEYFDFSITHRYLDSHPFLQNSNRIDLRAFYRMFDDWGLLAYQRWELDDSTLEMQEYAIYRDLISWTAALGTTIRDNRGETEFGFALTFTLKEFPQIGVPFSFDPGAGSN